LLHYETLVVERTPLERRTLQRLFFNAEPHPPPPSPEGEGAVPLNKNILIVLPH